MMVQLSLFPEEFPELELCPTNLTEEEISILEKIAREVADTRLTFEDTDIFPLVRTKYAYPKNRLETMLSYIHKKQDGVYHYLVKNNLAIVGYVGIWDGVLSNDTSEGGPALEMAFLLPRYNPGRERLIPKIRQAESTIQDEL